MSLKNAALDQVRVNVKNDQTYTMTAALAFNTLGTAVLQGYTTNPGDLGKAIFTSNLTSASLFTSNADNAVLIDLIFANTGASSTRDILVFSGTNNTFLRCVFHGARGSGLIHSGFNAVIIECEAYDCNKSNTSGKAGFVNSVNAGLVLCYNCYSHDHTGGTFADCYAAVSSGVLLLVNCIAATSGGNGASMSSTSNIISINSNFYNNTGHGISLTMSSAKGWCTLLNNNFLKNGGKGVNNTVASQGGILYNNGRGAGTQANGGADVLQCIVDTSTDITYASNVTPWNAPTTGDFRTTLAAAKGVGRGAFTETDGTNTGTIGYPDIGAAQAIVPAASGGLRLAGIGGLAA